MNMSLKYVHDFRFHEHIVKNIPTFLAFVGIFQKYIYVFPIHDYIPAI